MTGLMAAEVALSRKPSHLARTTGRPRQFVSLKRTERDRLITLSSAALSRRRRPTTHQDRLPRPHRPTFSTSAARTASKPLCPDDRGPQRKFQHDGQEQRQQEQWRKPLRRLEQQQQRRRLAVEEPRAALRWRPRQQPATAEIGPRRRFHPTNKQVGVRVPAEAVLHLDFMEPPHHCGGSFFCQALRLDHLLAGYRGSSGYVLEPTAGDRRAT